MGVRLLHESALGLGDAFDSLGAARRSSAERQDRQDELDAKRAAEKTAQDRLEGLRTASDTLFTNAQKPDSTREGFARDLQPFTQAAIEAGRPDIVASTISSIDQIFKGRESAQERDLKAKQFGANLGIKKDELELKKEKEDKKNAPKSFDDRIKGLSAEKAKRFDSTSMGLAAVLDMEKALDAGVDTVSLVGDNDFTIAERDFKEALGRLQSGGAINKDEEKSFLNMAPKFLDKPDVRKKKISRLKKEMASRISTLGFTPQEALEARKKAGESIGNLGSGAKDTPNTTVLGKSAFESLKNENRDAFLQEVQAENADRAAKGIPPMTPQEQAQAMKVILESQGFAVDLSKP